MKRRHIFVLAASACLVALAGCGPVRLVATTNIPPPLVLKLPVSIALFIPAEFSEYVHKEERWSTAWEVNLGKAQTQGISRLLNAMFERVAPVESIAAGTQIPNISAILEPSIEEYAFVTPRDAGSSFFAVSIKYRVNVYLPDGKLADSWGFTGYGTAPAQGLSSTTPLAAATALAMRDAGAKLAVEFREQAIVRGLLPESATADSPPSAPGEQSAAPTSGAQSSETTAPETDEAPAATPPENGAPATESAPEPETDIAPEPGSPPEVEAPTEAPADEPAPEAPEPIEPEVEAFRAS